jgi:flagellar basal-body rod modification protein FlgD
MVSAVTDANQTSSTADVLASATDSSAGMGKDAFLKLLVAQISHQDPLKPMDDTAFVAQLAQFSSLEQSIGINKRLDDLAAQERAAGNTQLAALVGKSVTLKGNTVSIDGSTIAAPVSFTLGGAATSVDVSIADSTGKTVRTMHLGARSAGLLQGVWDGRDDTGLAQPAGTYQVIVTAKSAAGGSVDVSQEATGVLQSIDFAGNSPKLELTSGVSAPASDLLRINAGTQ